MTIEDGAAAVRQLARQAHDLAAAVRQSAAELGVRADGVCWRSPAAVHARALAADQQGHWRSAAAELDELADLLLAHGQAASERAALLEAAAATARDLVA